MLDLRPVLRKNGHIENNIGCKIISRIRAGNYGVGNTYKKIKKCLLCEGKNNESHLIMKCPELAVVRNATRVNHFIDLNKQLNDDQGCKLLRKFLDPKTNIRVTLENRVQDIVYILKTWEVKVKTLQGEEETFCYCRQNNDAKRPMVQCDMCSDWFHFECAGLSNDFATLEEWFCQKCSRDSSDPSKESANAMSTKVECK